MLPANQADIALKSNQVPFIVRPISSAIANRIISMIVYPNVKKHLAFLEKQLETSGGGFLTGPDLTAADILMSYPLLGGKTGFDGMGKFAKGTAKESFPKVYECKLEARLSPSSVETPLSRQVVGDNSRPRWLVIADTGQTWTDWRPRQDGKRLFRRPRTWMAVSSALSLSPPEVVVAGGQKNGTCAMGA